MDKSRKRIRVCLICVVLTAVVIGLFYYYYEMQGNQTMDEGTLIANAKSGLRSLWQ